MSLRKQPDFDAAYGGTITLLGTDQIPWNIGEPQPEIAALIAAGRVRGEVLDAGCGVGETSLYLASRGYSVVGMDLSPNAIGQARERATEAGLPPGSEPEFEVADITSFTGYDGRFGTVIDSTLFHTLPVDSRSDYLASVARAAAPNAALYVLVFSAEFLFPGDVSPNAVTEPELRSVVSEHWRVDSVERATIAAIMPATFTEEIPRDDRGRCGFPAFLLSATRPAR